MKVAPVKRTRQCDLFLRLLQAARRTYPSRAAVLGMHFERWCQRQVWYVYIEEEEEETVPAA